MRKNEEKAAEHLLRATMHTAQSNASAAEKELEEAVKLDPGSWVIHYTLGICYGGQAKYKEAARVLDKAAKMNCNSTDVFVSLARALKEVGEMKRAAVAFERALILGARDGETYQHLGLCYVAMNDYNAAARTYGRWLKAEPDNYEAHQGLAAAFAAQRRWAEAAPRLERAIELGSQQPQRYRFLGIVYTELRDAVKAVAALRKAVEEEPNDVDVRLRLGDALRGALLFDEAEREARRALDISPGDDRVKHLLNVIRQNREVADRAREEQFKKALRSDAMIGVIIPRQPIETRDTATIVDYLNQLIANADTVRKCRDRLAFDVQGYGDDPSEHLTVPEIREYMKLIDEAFPYWLWFMSVQAPTLSLMILSTCPHIPFGDGSARRRIEAADFVTHVGERFARLDDLHTRFGLSHDEINARIKQLDAHMQRVFKIM